MKTFRFHAKRGQASTVCRLLTERVGKPRCTTTSEGVMITLPLPMGVSKRSVDRMLHREGVPGASSRRNKYPVLKGDKYKVMYHPKASDWFQWVDPDKGFMGVVRYGYYDMGCECCSYYTLIDRDGRCIDY
jgi:hypothetical protein